ncbi:transcription elongation factor A protein 3-like isoform X3 [Pleurodeles waltl]|uniref:transcription elongation factor A protein 3-like isoform X3 n=1 Tax=Pleurodeles waltl TaxID=8319 RepID=UPI003709AD43
MGREEELMKIAKKLEKMVSLKNLATRLGVTVNSLRKHCPDQGVTELATMLIKNWKRLLDMKRPRHEVHKRKKEKEKGLETSCHMRAGEPIQLCKSVAETHKDQDRTFSDLKALSLGTVPYKHAKEHTPGSHRNLPIKSPKPISHAAAPHTHPTDPRCERTTSVTSPKPFPPVTASKSALRDPRLERKQSVASPKPVSEPAAPKVPPSDHKLERKASADARPTTVSPLKRPSTERRPSTSSNPAASPPVPRKNSTENRDERRQSSGSNPTTSLIDSQKNSSGREERRPSIHSLSMASPPRSQKKSLDSKDERAISNTTKPETPKTPSSPSSPLTNCILNPVYYTGNSVRDKCVEMIAAALKFEDDYTQFGTNCEQKAAEIEDYIYKDVKATDMKYRNRVRSRISNLKDPKNPNLRRNVLCGAISAERIAGMTSEEMASDELKELRSTLTQEAIREHQMAKTGGTQSDFLQCGKCKKKNCTYNQVQTRSADEPMTTFVLCNECGNRWKFC